MQLRFKDNSVRELPFNAKLAARLIVLSQLHDEVDYRVELDPELSHAEKKRQLDEIQHYVDHYRTMKKCGKNI